MPSKRHNPNGSDDTLLDAARACILAVGWKRTTLTDVARRASVSRMTIYRRWPDMQTLLADLMTREWSQVAAESALEWEHAGKGSTARADVSRASAVRRVADGVATTVARLRDNELFRKIVDVDPELLLPYLLDRRGRTQDSLLALLEAAITDGQAEGSIREADASLMARSVLLTTHGFVLSARTMTEPMTQPMTQPMTVPPGSHREPSIADLDDELRALIERYLAR